MKILVFAEQREGKFKKSAFEAVQAAKQTAERLNGELVTLVVGDAVDAIAAQLSPYGAGRVLAASDPRLARYSTTAYAKIVAAAAEKEGAGVGILAATQMGKDLAPRLAGKLKAGLAADCTALAVENGDVVATRPVYAGKAMIALRVTSPVKIFSLRPNVFTAAAGNGAQVSVERFDAGLADADFAARVTGVKISEGRPDVTEAGVIVSGGRGLKGPEHFHLV